MIKVYQLTQPQNNFFCAIPYKGCLVEVKFEHGNVVKGIFAKFTTNDKFYQRAIEASEMYGKLFKLVETFKEPNDDEEQKKALANTVKKVATPAAGGNKGKTGGKKTNPEPDPEPDPEPEPGNKKKITFESVADAIVYIATNYEGTEVHSEEEAIAFLAEHDITAEVKS